MDGKGVRHGTRLTNVEQTPPRSAHLIGEEMAERLLKMFGLLGFDGVLLVNYEKPARTAQVGETEYWFLVSATLRYKEWIKKLIAQQDTYSCGAIAVCHLMMAIDPRINHFANLDLQVDASKFLSHINFGKCCKKWTRECCVPSAGSDNNSDSSHAGHLSGNADTATENPDEMEKMDVDEEGLSELRNQETCSTTHKPNNLRTDGDVVKRASSILVSIQRNSSEDSATNSRLPAVAAKVPYVRKQDDQSPSNKMSSNAQSKTTMPDSASVTVMEGHCANQNATKVAPATPKPQTVIEIDNESSSQSSEAQDELVVLPVNFGQELILRNKDSVPLISTTSKVGWWCRDNTKFKQLVIKLQK